MSKKHWIKVGVSIRHLFAWTKSSLVSHVHFSLSIGIFSVCMHGTTCDSAEIVGVGGTVHVCGRVLDKFA